MLVDLILMYGDHVVIAANNTFVPSIFKQNQSDLKKYWMPDSVSKECYECGEKFTTFRRKHHCRVCGQVKQFICSSTFANAKNISHVQNNRLFKYNRYFVRDAVIKKYQAK